MTDILPFALGLIEIVWINVLLSGDNAIFIALACRKLPKHQQNIGIALGAAGAVVLRVVFTLLTVQLLHIPFLKLGGGLFVVYLAARLPCQTDRPPAVEEKATLLGAVGAIAVADTVMSLDNALALGVAANGSVPLIVFGLLLSAPLVVFGARLLSTLMQRWPILVWTGAAILGWAGGALVAEDPGWHRFGLGPLPDHLAGALGSTVALGAAAFGRYRDKA